MANNKDMQTMNILVEHVEKTGEIHYIDLVMQTGFSVSTYNKLKPYVAKIFGHRVEYGKDQIWRKIEGDKNQ